MPGVPAYLLAARAARTTSGDEGAALIGTDAKSNLGGATNVEAALTAIDGQLSAFDADLIETRFTQLETAPPGDEFEIRGEYGITSRRCGDVYFLSGYEVSGTPPDIDGGTGITVNEEDGAFTVEGYEGLHALTDAATVTLDLSQHDRFELVMDSSRPDRNIAFANGVNGQFVKLRLVQGSSGGCTVTWPVGAKYPGGTAPVLSDTADHWDWVVICVRSSTAFDIAMAISDVEA